MISMENLEFIFPVSAISFFGESQPPDERPAGCGEAIVVSHEVGVRFGVRHETGNDVQSWNLLFQMSIFHRFMIYESQFKI